ncbi:MAG: TlpA family protein disulfide reductase [Gammaproteobacteria bacterium]|nr:TlpA family protein disulfide reductase [Gammaproteobacteria bacterium]MDH5800386.1 TlpA family protein disulfide reductase [Gammaproteobacteria bacterium]
MSLYYFKIIRLILLLSCAVPLLVAAQTQHTETLPDDVDILINKHPGSGNYLILWIASGYGFRDGHVEMARRLAKNGIEVWQIDLLESQFLPRSVDAIKSLNGKHVADLIQIARQQSGKKIVLMAGSYGSVPVLRGMRIWQSTQQNAQTGHTAVVGSILFSPSLYQNIPPLGMEPQYLPITYSSNSPIYIFQGATHGTRWQLSKLVDALHSGGSQTYTHLLPDIGSVFFEPENPIVKPQFDRLPRRIVNAIKLLQSAPMPQQAADWTEIQRQKHTGLDNRLKPYRGTPVPPPIDLPDISGKRYTRQNYIGQITVINFWASWCAPCVEEIPSLNRLRSKMSAKPFELISINYAEKTQTIQEFMKTVKVDFPVLLDVDGSEAGVWNVIAFPSTFVIGPDGRIHYGVNAGIEWDQDEVLQKLNLLLSPPQ